MQQLISKRDIANSFSQAARTYDSVAELQRQVGEQLLARVPLKHYPSVLDLGCGTGHFSQELKQKFNPNCIVGLDIAEGMVKFASQIETRAGLSWCCADAEALPLSHGSVSLIFSNLALQWCNDLDGVMTEAMRVLRPGGYFVFSTLGPGTLKELRLAWQSVDEYTHVNQFFASQAVKLAAQSAGFEVELSEEEHVMEYQHLRELTHELKSLGAHNLNSGRPVGLTGRQKIQKFKHAYEAFRNNEGNLPATYQTYFFILRKAG